MQNDRQSRKHLKTGRRTGIWPALALALGFHALILLLPLATRTPAIEPTTPHIELQLSTYNARPPLPEDTAKPVQIIPPPPVAEPEAPTETRRDSLVDTQTATEPPVMTPLLPAVEPAAESEEPVKQPATPLTSVILSRQFITEASVTEQIFGKPLKTQATEYRKEFHYPVRQSMLTLLDQPMQELPFAYTPGLIRFAYAPGVKGDIQRFWDVITPEFGWITNNGTEFRCVWVVIIAACGWK